MLVLQNESHEGFLGFADLHAGFWNERNMGYSQKDKAEAVLAFSQHAVSQGIHRVISIGDTADDRRDRKYEWKHDARAIRTGLESMREKEIMPGNHDPLSVKQFKRRFGHDFEVRDEESFVDPTGILVAHGHHYDAGTMYRLVRNALKNSLASHWAGKSREIHKDQELLRELREVDEFYKWLEWFEAQSPAARWAGEHALTMVRHFRQALSNLVRSLPMPSNKVKGYFGEIADNLGLQNIQIAAHMAAASGAWATTSGHTHYPGLFIRTVVDNDGKPQRKLAANPGSFIQEGQPLTAILAESEKVTLLQYVPVKKQVMEIQTVTRAEVLGLPEVQKLQIHVA